MTTNAGARNPSEASKALDRLPQLAGPLLQFDLQEELQRLRQRDSWQRETGRSSRTLAKYSDFRILLILMKAKTQMNEHRAEGRVSIHPLLGTIFVHLPDQKITLQAGQLLVLDRGVLHDVEAVEESAFLLTIAWPKGASEPKGLGHTFVRLLISGGAGA
jgi:quercetin dioxygenase-like cupin family protein